ncbi:EntF family bacteriocin induction factor [Pediococcus stilesii]|nr:EntF family bacteriocin induction factor [Pediococcus stilesii]
MEKENIMYQKLTSAELKKITGGKYMNNYHSGKPKGNITTCIFSFFKHCN